VGGCAHNLIIFGLCKVYLQAGLLIPYRGSGTTYKSHLQGVNIPSSAVKVPRQRPLILLVTLSSGLSKTLASEEGKVMRIGLCCGYAAAK